VVLGEVTVLAQNLFTSFLTICTLVKKLSMYVSGPCISSMFTDNHVGLLQKFLIDTESPIYVKGTRMNLIIVISLLSSTQVDRSGWSCHKCEQIHHPVIALLVIQAV